MANLNDRQDETVVGNLAADRVQIPESQAAALAARIDPHQSEEFNRGVLSGMLTALGLLQSDARVPDNTTGGLRQAVAMLAVRILEQQAGRVADAYQKHQQSLTPEDILRFAQPPEDCVPLSEVIRELEQLVGAGDAP